MRIFPILFALAAMSIAPTSAQIFSRPDSPACGWMTFGSALTGFGQGAGYASLSHSSRLGLLSLRYVGHLSNYVEVANGTSTTWDQIHEVSALYGISVRPLIFMVSASTGFGIVWMKEFPASHHKSIVSIGVPIEAQVLAVLLPILGIGVNASVNLNPHAPYGDVFLTMQLGKLR